MKTEKILIAENEAVYNELIQYEQLKRANGKTLISMLKGLAIDLNKVNDWKTDVEQPLSKQFPKASIAFNVQSSGIENEFNSAKNFFEKNQSLISFEQFTDEDIENIKESSRIFIEDPSQIEVYTLFHTILNSAKRLKELNVKMELEELRLVNVCFYGGNRYQELILSPRELTATLMKLSSLK